jgi:peptide/nickel transport system substrate-binding protein
MSLDRGWEDGRVDRRRFLVSGGSVIAATSSLSMLLAACGGGDDAQSGTSAAAGKAPAKPTGTFQPALPSNITNFDPSNTGQEADLTAIAMACDALVDFDSSYKKFVPALATSWEVSGDGREYVFQLRDGVTFHDGEPFDSAAVKANFEYFKGTAFGSFLLPKSYEIDASDPMSIRFMLKAPFPDFVRHQTSFLRLSSPKAIRGGDRVLAKAPVGTGPYRFVSYTPSDNVTLEANEDYWGKGPYFERVVLKIVKDSTTRFNGLLSGSLDAVHRVQPTQVAQVKSNSKFGWATVNSWTTAYLHIQTQRPAMQDAKVRQAIAHAIDRQAIIDSVVLGQGQAGDYMPESLYGYVPPETTYEYDPAKSRKLLQEAGVSLPHKITIATTAEVILLADKIANAIAAQLDEAGFSTEVSIISASLLSEQEAAPPPRDYDILYDEHNWLDGGPIVYAVGQPATDGAWENAEFERLREKLNTTADGPDRIEVIGEIQELIATEVPGVGFAHWDFTSAWDKSIQGYQPPVDGVIPRYATAYRSDS